MATITFITPDGGRHEVEAIPGLSVMQITKVHPFALEAACGGALSCGTCHVMVREPWADRLPPPGEDEAGMLDVLFGITPWSRLGCQVIMTEALDGLEVSLPEPMSTPLGQ